jgi:hypothetical protein
MSDRRPLMCRVAAVPDYARNLPKGDWGNNQGYGLKIHPDAHRSGDGTCTLYTPGEKHTCSCGTRPHYWQETPAANGVPSTYRPVYLYGGCPYSAKVAFSENADNMTTCSGYFCSDMPRV